MNNDPIRTDRLRLFQIDLKPDQDWGGPTCAWSYREMSPSLLNIGVLTLLPADDDDFEGAGFWLRAMAGHCWFHLRCGKKDGFGCAIETHGASTLGGFYDLFDAKLAVFSANHSQLAIPAGGEGLPAIIAGGITSVDAPPSTETVYNLPFWSGENIGARYWDRSQ